MSLEPLSTVVDTVVLRYFLLIDEIELLVELLGSPMGAPRIVFDPNEDSGVPLTAGSEFRRSIEYQQAASEDPARDKAARAIHLRNAKRLARIAELHAAGRLVTLDLTAAELDTVAQLTSPTRCRTFGLTFPLDSGEAACVAIAVARNLTLATDDGDALKALQVLAPQHPYERIRRLLQRAGSDAQISRHRANQIHREMQLLGFWDRQAPFPDHE